MVHPYLKIGNTVVYTPLERPDMGIQVEVARVHGDVVLVVFGDGHRKAVWSKSLGPVPEADMQPRSSIKAPVKTTMTLDELLCELAADEWDVSDVERLKRKHGVGR